MESWKQVDQKFAFCKDVFGVANRLEQLDIVDENEPQAVKESAKPNWNPEQSSTKKILKKCRRFADQLSILFGCLLFSSIYAYIFVEIKNHPLGSCHAESGDLVPLFERGSSPQLIRQWSTTNVSLRVCICLAIEVAMNLWRTFMVLLNT